MNRVCSALTNCDYTSEPGQYMSKAPSRYDNRECSAVIRCGKGQYMSENKKATSQRVYGGLHR